ncbi:MAG: hypothetical protein QW327_00305 [Candidatus Odinarchaeota archaeon]
MSKNTIRALAIGIALLFAVGLAAPSLIQARPSQLPDEYDYIGHRFTETSWSTEVDWMDIFRLAVQQVSESLPAAANLTGVMPPEFDNLSVMTYHAFVNQYNYWMLYSGFEYIYYTDGVHELNGTMPMQTIIQSYKTSSGLEVYSVQTYLLIAAFQDDNVNGVFDNDSEHLFLTVGFGFDVSTWLGMFPNSTLAREIFETPMLVTIEPLTQVNGGYEWGMKYKGIKLLIIDRDGGTLLGLMSLKELDFHYVLGFDQANGRVTINTYYTIGAPERLLLSDGTYIYNDPAHDNYTLTDFFLSSNIVLGIVNLQLTSIIDPYHHPVTSVTHNETAVNSSTEDLDLSDSWYTTYAGEERVFQVDFGTKKTYTTTHPNGTGTGEHLAITRLYNAYLGKGILEAPVYAVSAALINLPSAIAVLYMSENMLAGIRALFGILFPFIPNGEEILENINTVFPLNIEANANYYVIYYPAWKGQIVEHDPVFIAFADLSFLLNPAILAPLVVIGIIAVVIVAMVIIRRRR